MCDKATSLLAVDYWQLPFLWSLSRSAQVTCETLEAEFRGEEPGKNPRTRSHVRVLLVSASAWVQAIRERWKLLNPVCKERSGNKYGVEHEEVPWMSSSALPTPPRMEIGMRNAVCDLS